MFIGEKTHFHLHIEDIASLQPIIEVAVRLKNASSLAVVFQDAGAGGKRLFSSFNGKEWEDKAVLCEIYVSYSFSVCLRLFCASL